MHLHCGFQLTVRYCGKLLTNWRINVVFLFNRTPLPCICCIHCILSSLCLLRRVPGLPNLKPKILFRRATLPSCGWKMLRKKIFVLLLKREVLQIGIVELTIEMHKINHVHSQGLMHFMVVNLQLNTLWQTARDFFNHLEEILSCGVTQTQD